MTFPFPVHQHPSLGYASQTTGLSEEYVDKLNIVQTSVSVRVGTVHITPS